MLFKNLFSKLFGESRRIKELENQVLQMTQELEAAREMALDTKMELQFQEWKLEQAN